MLLYKLLGFQTANSCNQYSQIARVVNNALWQMSLYDRQQFEAKQQNLLKTVHIVRQAFNIRNECVVVIAGRRSHLMSVSSDSFSNYNRKTQKALLNNK